VEDEHAATQKEWKLSFAGLSGDSQFNEIDCELIPLGVVLRGLAGIRPHRQQLLRSAYHGSRTRLICENWSILPILNRILHPKERVSIMGRRRVLLSVSPDGQGSDVLNMTPVISVSL
jgi:hypothetical protein